MAGYGGISGGPVLRFVPLTENTATTSFGRGIQISASAAGTVTLLSADGASSIVVNVSAGDNIYPYSVSKATAGTAIISAYTNLQ